MKAKTFFVALLMVFSSVARAGTLPDADFILQQQIDAPVEVLHPNPFTHDHPWILIGIASQTLVLYDAMGREQVHFLMSSAKRGPGEHVDSLQTPRGWHRVCAKIGDGADPDTIIVHRQITPWHYSAALHAAYPDKDWILGRILWLCGMEPGKNQGGDVDSHDRAIYIHGAGAHVTFGIPTSSGCIRLSTSDIISLYPMVALGTDVDIEENR